MTKMGRFCNLELCLSTPSVSFHSNHNNQHQHQHQPMNDLLSGSPKQEKEQQMTIFYDGRSSVCDVTELQARAIISVASQEIEKTLNSRSGSDTSSQLLLQSQLYSPNGHSMTRSLQRFLHKRKHRIQATSPYNH